MIVRVYRDLNDIPHDIGTAVNVQEMVFGNSGSKVARGSIYETLSLGRTNYLVNIY